MTINVDPVEWAKNVAATVKTYVANAIGAVNTRIDDLENRLKSIPAGPQGERGEKGETGERGEPGPSGVDGKNGLNAFEVAVSLGFEGSVDDWLKTYTGPKGEKGDAGAPGERGEKGDPGIQGEKGIAGEPGKSVTIEEIQPLIEQAVKSIPAPKDGRDGVDGKDGTSISVDDLRPLFEAEQAKWALEFERRAHDTLQRAIDRMPKPKDGVDGLGFDDLDVQFDGVRTVVLKFTRGEKAKEFKATLPIVIDQGVYKQGSHYEKGDGVTFGGSFWIAQRDTQAKPGESEDWRLAVKKGRDGRDGAHGARGIEGRPGKDAIPFAMNSR